MGVRLTSPSGQRIAVGVLCLGCLVLAPLSVLSQETEEAPQQVQTLWEAEQQAQRYSLSRRGEMTVQVGDVGDMELFLGLQTVGRLQALFQEDVFRTDFDEEPPETMEAQDSFVGFQTAWGNLRLLAYYDERIEVYFDLYIASRPNPDTTYGHEGFLLFHSMPAWLDGTFVEPIFNYISVKAGHFEIDFGDHRYRRSDNARVQQNPLIGNYLVDPKVTELGLEIFADRRRFNWLIGAGSGTVTENFEEGTGTSLRAKVWAYPLEDLRLALSNYWVDHSENLTGFPEPGAESNLYNAHRSGGAYAGVMDNGDAPGTLVLGNGQHVLANQFDVTAIVGPLEVYGHAGLVQDFDTTGAGEGSPTDRWHYQAFELLWSLSDRIHLAGRYSGAGALLLADQESSGNIHRFQAGGGLELARGLLFKAEYTAQLHRDFVEGDQMEGVDLWEAPFFHGVLFEASYAF